MSEMNRMEHRPVMLDQALQQLALKPNGVYLDCTFGRGGHSVAILNRLGPDGKLLALDRDLAAIASVVAEQLRQDRRFTLAHRCFAELAQAVEAAGLTGKIDGILIDLGVSSPQLDTPERGFSFLRDGPLDMRMDTSTGLSAAQWLAQVDERQLADVLFEFGEERFARRIARAIVAARAEAPITGTKQLADLISQAVPMKEKHKHPATRGFQAIRIVVNDELNQLRQALSQAVTALAPGGRLVVIAFHSLEDRIVKRFIRAESGFKHDPGRLPVKDEQLSKGLLKSVGKALKADASEIEQNPRARSAVMRAAEKL